jgi:hypothetical protein
MGSWPCGRPLPGHAARSSWRKGRPRRPSKASGAVPPCGPSWTHL